MGPAGLADVMAAGRRRLGAVTAWSGEVPLYNRKLMMHLHDTAAMVNWHWVWLVVAAFLAGVLNAVAGGGSFLSFPAMLGMGVLPVQANATNTVAIWPGQLTSVAAYRDDVRKNLSSAWLMGLAGLLGGTAGRSFC